MVTRRSSPCLLLSLLGLLVALLCSGCPGAGSIGEPGPGTELHPQASQARIPDDWSGQEDWPYSVVEVDP